MLANVLCHTNNIHVVCCFISGCKVKVHKDHLDKEEEFIGYCKVNFDIKTAKELLILANSAEDQKMWVQRLSRKIAKKGYAQSNSDKSNSGYVCIESARGGRRFSYILKMGSSLEPQLSQDGEGLVPLAEFGDQSYKLPEDLSASCRF